MKVSKPWRRLKSAKGYVATSDFEALQDVQGKACAICNASFATTRPQVDHDHETNVVRGLLCISCNVLLGKVEKSSWTEWYDKALEYLRKGSTSQMKVKFFTKEEQFENIRIATKRSWTNPIIRARMLPPGRKGANGRFQVTK